MNINLKLKPSQFRKKNAINKHTKKISLDTNIYECRFNSFKVIKYTVVGIYELTKVKQYQDNLFFDSPKYLYALFSENHYGMEDYESTKTVKSPIDRYSFSSFKDLERGGVFFFKKEDAVIYSKMAKKEYLKNKDVQGCLEV